MLSKEPVYFIASHPLWLPDMIRVLSDRLKARFVYIAEQKQLNTPELFVTNPKKIFFPHWSYIVPKEIYENFECVIFHMTDLPFGRGGSPLQNLIARGIYETKISALKCGAELDAGPVYLKKPLSLFGTAQEIYLRANKIMEEMIIEIIENHIEPESQVGEIVCFKRRVAKESDISLLDSLDKIFDYIRMLDADGYPKAFLETKYFRLEFSRASFKGEEVLADVKFIKREEAGDD